MFVNELKLVNFRNYGEQRLKLLNGINLLVGKNGQGKTNMLEAIFFSAIGKSPKTSKDSDLINWSKDRASFCVDVSKKSGTKKIEVVFSRQTKKSIRVNGVNLLKIGDLLGNVNVIFFSPDELKLVKDAPQDRRKFLDTDISQLNKNYFYNLTKYNKILDERNKLLKNYNGTQTLEQTLPIWDSQLAETGSKIIFERIKFLNKLKSISKEAHSYLTGKKEELELEYAGIAKETEEEIKQEFLKELKRVKDKDLKLGYTNVGPHRDDIKLVVNGVDIRSFGSQGQQRTVALSMKLAELEIFKEEIGEYPVLLLDDVLSELDQDRQQRLLNYSKRLQTIITTTQYDPFMFQDANIIKINGGKVVE
ncbi:MAG: DNA replication/repair protein RecF [Clostridia bacterium]|nr:DNA replication/repair protein RecF [Clostridia bacterium]